MPNLGTEILNPRVADYLLSLLQKRDAVVSSIEEDAARRGVPIIGPLVGNVISLILQTSGAKRALEIGTATGYSGIWIARALSGKTRKLFTIEMDESRRMEAKKNFERAGVSKVVEILAGNAKSVVPRIAKSQHGSFDAVFLDVGEKTVYVDLLAPCLRLISVGGFLIADNTLWNGEVADAAARSEEARTMRKFNALVFADRSLEAALIPIRDGFTIARKKTNK